MYYLESIKQHFFIILKHLTEVQVGQNALLFFN
jgi:hypothetical protein